MRPYNNANDLPLLPNVGDYFYVGTDERNETELDYLRSQKGILLEDILNTNDRDELGPMVLYTDVVAILDQLIMSRSAYFYGHVSKVWFHTI